MRKLAAETFGTFALVFAGTGAIVVNAASDGQVTHVGVALTFGLIVLAMVYAVGDVSGAHLNPAVTAGFAVTGRFPVREVPPYVLAQCAGEFLASGVLRVLFHDHATLGIRGRRVRVRSRGGLLRRFQSGVQAVSDPQPKKRILCVCVENSNRSQMAEAFARIHGVDAVEAHSAGSRPSGRVNPRAIVFMAERGHDLSAHSSKALDAFNGTTVDVAVTMGCGDSCPLVKAARRGERNIPDPKDLPDDEFRKVRDLIEAKVKGLLGDLAGRM